MRAGSNTCNAPVTMCWKKPVMTPPATGSHMCVCRPSPHMDKRHAASHHNEADLTSPSSFTRPPQHPPPTPSPCLVLSPRPPLPEFLSLCLLLLLFSEFPSFPFSLLTFTTSETVSQKCYIFLLLLWATSDSIAISIMLT